jgi:hypothetical protein
MRIFTQQYKQILTPEIRVGKNQILPCNIYRISTYKEGVPPTKVGLESRYVFVIGKLDGKIHCLLLNHVLPDNFITFLNKLRNKSKPIEKNQPLSEILKLFPRDGKQLFEGFVKNSPNIYSHKLDNYRTYFIDKIQTKIGEYQPVLLTNSDEYNEESSVQSNCVKTYVTRPSSLIISLRKGYYGDRATIEYSLTKVNDNIEVGRVQSLGRFNGKLGEEWDDILFKLDEVILSSVKDERFETVKIVKKCKNGVIFSSDSYFDHGNKLRWTHKSIDSGPRDIWAELF